MARPTHLLWPLFLLMLLSLMCSSAASDNQSVRHSVSHGSVYRALRGRSDSKTKKFEDKPASEELPRVWIGKQKLDLSLKESEGELTPYSGRADSFCPDAASIAPCICTTDTNNSTDLDCSDVESEKQLAAVFQQNFPVRELRGFNMTSNDAIEVLGNILNGIMFEVIHISPGSFAINAISQYLLLSTRLTLRYFRIANSCLTTGNFPFPVLSRMEALDSLAIVASNLTSIPKLNSSSIHELSFSYGSIDTIIPGTFDDVPNLSYLDLRSNSVTELREGTLPIREGPMEFSSHYNDIYLVEPGTFFFFDAKGAASGEKLEIWLQYNKIQSLQAGTFPLRNANVTLYLYNNQISNVEPGTIVLPEAKDLLTIRLSLHNNLLETFDEAVFGKLMLYTTELQLHDNPLSCGCDIAWLILNQDFMDKLDIYSECNNGTNLHELNRQYYENSC